MALKDAAASDNSLESSDLLNGKLSLPQERDGAGGMPRPSKVEVSGRDEKSSSVRPTSKAPDRPLLFAGAQPVVSVIRTERPAVKAEQAVEFFSIKSKAQTVAFVVDASGSMDGHRFNRARLEVMRSINRLKRDQGVYVIFFNDGPVPLPGESASKPGLVLPTGWVKYEIGKRLERISANGGTHPASSLEIAASLNPDVIFLLSDGIFSPLQDSMLADFRKRSIKVNTIAFESEEGSRQLDQIAQATGGTFRFIPHERSPSQNQLVNAELAEELITELETATGPQWEPIHAALVDLAHGQDFGSTAAAWWPWYRDLLIEGYRSVPQGQIAEIIRANRNSHSRHSAVLSARDRKLDIPEVLVPVLTDKDPTTVQAARQALVKLADGFDFGPEETASSQEAAQSVGKWQRWLGFRLLSRDLSQEAEATILAALRDSDAVRRWAAASVVRQKKLSAPDELLKAFQDSDVNVRAEASRSLVALASHSDLGPNVGKNPGRYIPDGLIDLLSHDDPQVQSAAGDALFLVATGSDRKWKRPDAPMSNAAATTFWNAWWQGLKNVAAQRRIVLARQLHKEGKNDPAARRFREIIQKYPGTTSANEAEQILRSLQ